MGPKLTIAYNYVFIKDCLNYGEEFKGGNRNMFGSYSSASLCH